MGVQGSRMEGHQGDAEQIGERDPRQLDGEGEFFRLRAKARRQKMDERRHEHPAERQRHDLGHHQQSEDLIGEMARRPDVGLLIDAQIGRDISGVKSAFAENRPEMIGQANGDRPGVAHGSGSDQGAHHDVAKKPGQAGKQREPADREKTSVHGPAALANGSREGGIRLPARRRPRPGSECET